MTLEDLQERLERLDVRLSLTGEGELELDIPQHVVLSSETMAALRTHKDALLSMYETDEYAAAVIARITWDGTSLADSIEAAHQWNAAIRGRTKLS